MPRYRHIVCIANRQLGARFPKKSALDWNIPVSTLGFPRRPRIFTIYQLMAYVALHQENYATIPNYLERELRYMDAGE
jgi:hypothetical protein